MTVREKIDFLLERGVLLMETPLVPESVSGAAPRGGHVVSDHASILDHDAGQFRHLYDPSFIPPEFRDYEKYYPEADLSPVLFRVDEGDPVAALEAADQIVVFGAEPSPVLDAALDAETPCFVVEFDLPRFASFVETLDLTRVRNAVFLAGSPGFVARRAETLFDAPIFTETFPVFLVPPDPAPEERAACLDVIRAVEILYYRRKIYPLVGHGMRRSFPFEKMHRELFYDQQKHVYENLPRYVAGENVSALASVLPETPAMVAAAGPELDENLDFIRKYRDRAVLICLNNALKTLSAAGIAPDLVLVVDPAVEVEKCFEGVENVGSALLVAHNYAATAGDLFPRVLFFGESRPELRHPTPSLAWHASVLSAGFSLAAYMGCPGCVLVGAQLCGRSPYGLGYARDSVHGAVETVASEIPSWLRLMPVETVSGHRAWASLNFLDAALWLNRAIERSPMRTGVRSDFTMIVGNAEPEAILAHGKGAGRILERLPEPSGPVQLDQAVEYARQRLREHRLAREMIARVLEGGSPEKARALLERFKADNTAYLVQRFPDYSEMRFHLGLRADGGRWRTESVRYFLEKVDAMLAGFQATLKASLIRLGTLRS